MPSPFVIVAPKLIVPVLATLSVKINVDDEFAEIVPRLQVR